MAHRATRDDYRVAVGEWTSDLHKGRVYKDLPPDVAEHLVEHGAVKEVPDDAVDNPWFDSEDMALNGGINNDQTHGPLRSNIKDMTTPKANTTTNEPQPGFS